MKKLIFAAALLCFAISLAYAAPMMLKGTIVDNACASGHKADMAMFVKTHPKDCALMPACAKSGYLLYTPDGKTMQFNDASNAKIIAFLNKKDSKLTVDVSAEMVGDKLNLVSIQNSK